MIYWCWDVAIRAVKEKMDREVSKALKSKAAKKRVADDLSNPFTDLGKLEITLNQLQTGRDNASLAALEALKGKKRCCGRCDGVNDICVSDMICEEHSTQGCEICYGRIEN